MNIMNTNQQTVQGLMIICWTTNSPRLNDYMLNNKQSKA